MTLPDLRRAADGPRLLVSVRSVREAEAAIAGGADIIDVKEPLRGSLGCPEPDVLESLCQTAAVSAMTLTTALGEVADSLDAEPFRIPDRFTFAKLGLAGLRNDPRWLNEWIAVRRRFNNLQPGIGWVAVAYVDESLAASPPIDDVAAAAIETGCAGLLLDTCDKRSGGLFDHVPLRGLDALAERMHAEGRFIAAAGRLTLNDLPRLASGAVDIVAVRSAACAGSDRRSAVSADLVAACKAALQARKRRLSGAC